MSDNNEPIFCTNSGLFWCDWDCCNENPQEVEEDNHCEEEVVNKEEPTTTEEDIESLLDEIDYEQQMYD
jgi:hypothetical protein